MPGVLRPDCISKRKYGPPVIILALLRQPDSDMGIRGSWVTKSCTFGKRLADIVAQTRFQYTKTTARYLPTCTHE